jgi:hypothetical protein
MHLANLIGIVSVRSVRISEYNILIPEQCGVGLGYWCTPEWRRVVVIDFANHFPNFGLKCRSTKPPKKSECAFPSAYRAQLILRYASQQCHESELSKMELSKQHPHRSRFQLRRHSPRDKRLLRQKLHGATHQPDQHQA